MGGQHETVTSQKKVAEPGRTEVVGKVRFHVSGVEIHFHDDEKKVKVAIPVADFFEAWQNLERKVPSFWQFADPQNKSLLVVQTAVVESSPGHPSYLDAAIRLERIDESDDFTTLRKLVTG